MQLIDWPSIKNKMEDESIYLAHRKLVDNVMYWLIYDALAIGTGQLEKIRGDRAGRHNRNVLKIRERAGLRVRAQIIRSLKGSELSMFFSHFGWEPETGKALIRDLLDGRNLEIGKEILESMKHAGRVYEHRGIGVIKARKEEQKRRQEAWERSLRAIDL